MKKILAVVLVFAFLFSPVVVNSFAAEKNTGAAALLSLAMPGTGEWYNSGWQGSFPWVECIVGYVCCLFQMSSALDAANGNTDVGMRFDFWSAPVK